MTFPVLSAGTSAYNLQRSLRFRSSASAYLNRTPASAGNRTAWTMSMWVKRGALSTGGLFSTINSGAVNTTVGFNADAIDFLEYQSATVARLTTTAVYRDPSAWYHLVLVWDSSNGTSTDRVRIYVNGTRITALSTATYPSSGLTSTWNNNVNSSIGTYNNGSPPQLYFDGYMTEINFIDGQALTPSSFGSTNAVTGVWQPAKYTGTYGTNGFYLPFTNLTSTTTLGNDFSGNSNNWTTNNISLTSGVTYDSMTDVPTLTSPTAANFAVMNPLWQGRTNAPTNGNLDYPASSVGIGTMDVSRFSSYWEITSTGGTTTTSVYSTAAATTVGVTTGLTYGFRFNSSTGALDYTTNGSSFTSLATGLTSGPYFVYVSTAASTTASFNGGQRPFAYTPPSGFVALNTFNLPSSTIPKGANFMAATLYTGTGSAQSISNAVNGVSFQPDWVWLKSRSGARNHRLMDTVRGINNVLSSDLTSAEYAGSALSSINSNGFTLNTTDNQNVSSETYIGWQWKANGAGVTNTSGSITSTVSANTTSGFSVVTYTGNATSGATIGHGLGVTPSMVIIKSRSAVGSWSVYHQTVGTDNYLLLNSTAASGPASGWISVSSSTIGNPTYYSTSINDSGVTYVAYCFTQIAGFSAFGSYTGNGSTDGPFVYTGFRPRYVLIKRTDASTGADWFTYDTSRNPYNTANLLLFSNLSDAEAASGGSSYLDILSNGFKARGNSNGINASAATYIYAAFAENPFKNALAR